MKKNIIAGLCIVISFRAAAQKKNIKTETFKVYGTCIQCKNRIENALADIHVYKPIGVLKQKCLPLVTTA